jgi:hypothetical protein
MNDQRLRDVYTAARRSEEDAEALAHEESVAQEEVAEAGAFDFLKRLGTALLESGGGRAERNKTLAELEAVLVKLSPRDYPELAENPVIQQFLEVMAERKAEASDDPPGTIYNAGTLAATKKRWQWRDLARFPVVTFTPNETIPVTFQGLTLMLIADTEMAVPSIFKDIYDERRRGHETAREHAAFLFRQRDQIDPTRADPSVVGYSSGLVRGHGMGRDGYRPGAGAFPIGAEEGEGEGG